MTVPTFSEQPHPRVRFGGIGHFCPLEWTYEFFCPVEWTDKFQKYDNDNFFLFDKFEDPLVYLKTPLSNISIELIKEKKVVIIIFLEFVFHSTGHKNSYVHSSGQKCPIPPNLSEILELR